MISIIVPVYNTSKYLEICLNSILSQTFREIEVIVVDDGSNDGSSSICDEYAKMDSCIIVIQQKNAGLVNARKTGFLAASNDLIGFVDSDDWIEPDMYEKLYRSLSENDVDIAMCGRYEEYTNISKPAYHGISAGVYCDDDLIKNVYPRMILNQNFFEWGLFPGYWDKLFRREVLKNHLLAVSDKIVMGEDAAGVYPCLMHAKSISILHECLYHYRQSATSMVRNTAKDIQEERDRFQVLYHDTMKKFREGINRYDFTEQWRKYILFLMLPRADVLYDGFYELDYLFPFPEIHRGDRIIIYGLGVWGKRLYDCLKKTSFCEVVAISDKNYRNMQDDGMEVISPDTIGEYEFDAIAVPVSYDRIRKEILMDLKKKYPGVQVYGMEEAEVFSDKTIRAFGIQ